VREIARGGMGQIYFGEDPQLKRQVAVKVSSESYEGEDPRFSKEAEVLALLAHPNIVPICTTGVDAQSRLFYSMKLVKGRTLQAVLNAIRDRDAAALKAYTRAALLTVFRKVCDAIAFAQPPCLEPKCRQAARQSPQGLLARYGTASFPRRTPQCRACPWASALRGLMGGLLHRTNPIHSPARNPVQPLPHSCRS